MGLSQDSLSQLNAIGRLFIATPPGTLSFTPVVTAHQSDGTTVSVAGAAWLGDPASTRDLEIPLGDIEAGL